MSELYEDGVPVAAPSLYTDEVKKHIYAVKPRLPKDFPLVTEDMGYYIIIHIDMRDFGHRTVEQRLYIAIEIERLRKLIEETGIRCVIEKA